MRGTVERHRGERVSIQCSVVGVREREREGMGGTVERQRGERVSIQCSVVGVREREGGRGWEEW